MSASPKYSNVRVSAEVAQRLREENRRRAAERAAQQAAEAARRREERLRQGQAAVKGRLVELNNELAAFNATPASRHVADLLQQLQARLAQIGQETPADEQGIARAEKEIHRARREIKQVIAQGNAAHDAQALEQEAATVLRWKYQAAEDRQGSRQFDPEGLARFEAALRKVEAQIARGDVAGARKAMTAVGRQFDQHRAEVERQRDAKLTRKQASEAVLARAQERVAELQSHHDVQRWAAPAITDISARADQLAKLIERDQFEHASGEAEKLLAESERVLKAAVERQALQAIQDYIAECTVKAFQDCGFVIDAVSQSPQGAGTDILIQARRLDGRALAASVPQEGPMQWLADGFSMQVVAGSNGQSATVCDEAQEHIEAVLDRLSTAYGFERSDLTWPGKDPHRPRKAAKRQRRSISHPAQRTREA